MNGHFTVCCSLVSAVVCEDSTLANGVTVLEPHSNVVNSEIFYQCEESGLVLSIIAHYVMKMECGAQRPPKLGV